jgi:hypothetical protein
MARLSVRQALRLVRRGNARKGISMIAPGRPSADHEFSRRHCRIRRGPQGQASAPPITAARCLPSRRQRNTDVHPIKKIQRETSMQLYDGLVYFCAAVMVCLYVYLGVMSQSNALKLGSPAIVAVLMVLYSLLPVHLAG